jgi:hypothetical protein
VWLRSKKDTVSFCPAVMWPMFLHAGSRGTPFFFTNLNFFFVYFDINLHIIFVLNRKIIFFGRHGFFLLWLSAFITSHNTLTPIKIIFGFVFFGVVVCVCVVPVSKARKNEEIKIVIPAGLMAITRDK